MATHRHSKGLASAFVVGACALIGASLLVAAELPAASPAPASRWASLGRFFGLNRAPSGVPGLQWVQIPGGTFTMGSRRSVDESPAHEVKVKTFSMAKTLVTNEQYRACVAAGACSALAEDPGMTGDDQPAVGATWEQAAAFSRWVGGRLPTEAEWEYAARSGGKDRKYPWGDEAASCDKAVLDAGAKQGCGRAATWPVCSKPAGNTEQGLCDMAGNANQWVQDAYHPSYEGAPADGSAWMNPARAEHVFRGGAWCSTPESLTTTVRPARADGYRGLGFRPVREAL